MDDNKILTWQYIGIIACVCILLTLAVISSFAFAISPNVNTQGVAQAYHGTDDVYYIEEAYLGSIEQYAVPLVAPSSSGQIINVSISFDDVIMPALIDSVDSSYTEYTIVPVCYLVECTISDSSTYPWLARVYSYSTLGNNTMYPDELFGALPDSYVDFFDAYSYSYNCDFGYQYVNNSNDYMNGYIYVDIYLSYMVYPKGYNAGYVNGYDIGYDNGYDIGYDEGNSEGLGVGYDNGYDSGYDNGFYQGRLDGLSTAADGDWMNIVSALFDAPINILFGTLQDTNNDGVVDTRVGGLLDFYIPWLNLDVSAVFVSLISLLIIVIVARFVLGLIM